MGDGIRWLDLNWWICNPMVRVVNLLADRMPLPLVFVNCILQVKQLLSLMVEKNIISAQNTKLFAVIYTSISVISSAFSFFQGWTQRAWRHNFNQRPKDLIRDRRQCCHQKGRHSESSRAPRKWGRYPHCCSHGDRPLTFTDSQHSWS